MFFVFQFGMFSGILNRFMVIIAKRKKSEETHTHTHTHKQHTHTHIYIYIYIYIYLTKKKLDWFYFSVISWILGNPTYHRSILIVLVHARHTPLFSTQLRFQITLYATKTCFCIFFHVLSYALVVLLANCYVDTLH